MPGAADSVGARNAGAFLHELLLHRYKSRWVRHSERSREDRVNALAVSRVVSGYLEQHPTASRGWGTDASAIKDVVWRALTGRSMSQETLELLINAFDIDHPTSDALWRQWSSAEPARVVVGAMRPRPGLSGAGRTYQTVQRQELHFIGPAGQPVRHRTVQAIRALVDDYRTHRFFFDTREVTISQIHGGKPGPLQRVDGALWAVDIALPHTLSAGEVAFMEYVTEFHNDTPLPPVFRYATHQRVEDVVIRVEFDPARLPAAVHWCTWDDYERPALPRDRWPAALDAEHAVSHSVDVVAQAAIGFTWEFEQLP